MTTKGAAAWAAQSLFGEIQNAKTLNQLWEENGGKRFYAKKVVYHESSRAAINTIIKVIAQFHLDNKTFQYKAEGGQFLHYLGHIPSWVQVDERDGQLAIREGSQE